MRHICFDSDDMGKMWNVSNIASCCLHAKIHVLLRLIYCLTYVIVSFKVLFRRKVVFISSPFLLGDFVLVSETAEVS